MRDRVRWSACRSPAAAMRMHVIARSLPRIRPRQPWVRAFDVGIDCDFEVILNTMKKAAGALRDAEVPFALGGGLAVWARGGAKTEHDVDFFVKPDDAERAQQALVAAGLEPETPPEGWLLKAWDGNVLVDLIYEPRGGP